MDEENITEAASIKTFLSILCMKIDVILKLDDNDLHNNKEIREALFLALKETYDTAEINKIDVNKSVIPNNLELSNLIKEKNNYLKIIKDED